jgi:hemerythrin
MAFFDWKENFSVGVKAIDNQHKKILELINELVESIRDSREDKIIKEVLADLKEYTHYHFGLEKKLFEKYKYPKSIEHLKEHEVFIDKINLLIDGAEKMKECVPMETLDYLRDWFMKHMVGVDKNYSKYFESIGKIEEIENTFSS